MPVSILITKCINYKRSTFENRTGASLSELLEPSFFLRGLAFPSQSFASSFVSQRFQS